MNPFSLTKPFNLQRLSPCRYFSEYRHGIGTIGTYHVPIPEVEVTIFVPILDFAPDPANHCVIRFCRAPVPIVPIVPILLPYLDGWGLRVHAEALAPPNTVYQRKKR